MLLSRYMTSTARDDYSYTRPSSRRGDPAIYPSLRSAQIEVVVALDVSGSITDKEISEFVAEVNAIKSLMRARIILHACDSKLAEGGPWVFESWEELVMPEHFAGGGGTSFCPVMEWAEAQDRQPDLLVYFTDAKGQFPEHEPAFPVIWLVKGKAQVPWGQRIQLN
jgi:predicted metal-dependent peptidase